MRHAACHLQPARPGACLSSLRMPVNVSLAGAAWMASSTWASPRLRHDAPPLHLRQHPPQISGRARGCGTWVWRLRNGLPHILTPAVCPAGGRPTTRPGTAPAAALCAALSPRRCHQRWRPGASAAAGPACCLFARRMRGRRERPVRRSPRPTEAGGHCAPFRRAGRSGAQAKALEARGLMIASC